MTAGSDDYHLFFPCSAPRFGSLPSSIFGGVSEAHGHGSVGESHIDFDKLNARFMMMKQNVGEFDSFL